MKNKLVHCIFSFLLVVCAGHASAIPVGLELSLVIDVSPSINTSEYNLQRSGYQAAFLDAQVQSAIINLEGGVAANVIFFSQTAVEKISWIHLTDVSSINAFATLIGGLTRTPPVNDGTDIAAGYNLAINSIENNDFEGARRVIDISADGPHNMNNGCPALGDGTDPLCLAQTNPARAAAELAGIVVNGLIIAPNEFPGGNGLNYFQNHIITSSGFAVTANSFNDFAPVVRDKIFREITDEPRVVPEPGSFALLMLGLLGIVAMQIKRDRSTDFLVLPGEDYSLI